MTKQMTTSDRARAAWSPRLRWVSTQGLDAGDTLEPEKVCPETTDEPGTQTCSTPEEPDHPPAPVAEAA